MWSIAISASLKAQPNNPSSYYLYDDPKTNDIPWYKPLRTPTSYMQPTWIYFNGILFGNQ